MESLTLKYWLIGFQPGHQVLETGSYVESKLFKPIIDHSDENK